MEKTIASISTQQARKLVLSSQNIPYKKTNCSALSSTLTTIEHLGYIQIDTISVIQRAHHHTLWNRNPGYQVSHLNDLLVSQQIFEYWSHAAAYLPMKDYRFSLPRKHAIASGNEDHWYTRNKQLMKSVLKRIESEGALMAKDFDNKGEKFGEWQTKPTKQALEYLFMQGELMIPFRNNFHKGYNLTERVLPNHIDTSMPTKEEYLRFLVTRFLRANGIAQASEIAYLLKNTKTPISNTLAEMTLNGELMRLSVNDSIYFALSQSLELLSKPQSKSNVKILSPFDNLIIQRKRMKELFGFNYLLECYVPEAKRKFGYFVLPILWNGQLVARMDCKADRKQSVLHIHDLTLESNLTKIDCFSQDLSRELNSFMHFNLCKSVVLHQTSPATFKPVLLNAINQLGEIDLIPDPPKK